MVLMNLQNQKSNDEYRRKLKNIKKRIKSLILENAALCDEVARIQENVTIVKEERKILLKKLLEYENISNSSYHTHESLKQSNGHSTKIKKKRRYEGDEFGRI